MNNPMIFFASSNSAKGFINHYPTIFGQASDVKHLYIVKGGPGTGKSRLMKRVGAYAAERGYTTIYYACSSDPQSVDGVKLIPPPSSHAPMVGILDGTAPHVCEPTLPGAREEILNLGEFWHTKRLREEIECIKAHTTAKANAYKKAYQYLSAAGACCDVARSYIAPVIHSQKLQRLADRLVEDIGKGEDFACHIGGICSVGMNGFAYLDTYRHMAKRVCEIEEYGGVGYELTERIYQALQAKKSHIWLSHHPIYPTLIDGIFDIKTATAYLIVSPHHPPKDTPTRKRQVKLSRYVLSDEWKTVRPHVRHATRLASDLEKSAVQALNHAGEHHFALENIYTSAMDFEAVEAYTRRVCKTCLE